MRRKLIIIIIPLVILSLIGGYLLLQQPEEAQAVWFDESWSYRRPLTVSNSGAEVTNQWVKFDIDTATLITNGKMQSDCDDARFTNINGEALRYFLDSASGACNTSSTDLEVLIPTIYTGATSTVVYFYYGNPSAGPGTEAAAFTETEFTPSQTTYGSEEAGPGPIAYWKFDEGYGATTNDSTSANNDGTIPNSSEMATSTAPASGWRTEDMCVSGKCLKFDGSNDYVDIGNTSQTSVKTISFWIRAGDTTSREIMDIDGTDQIELNSSSQITATSFPGTVTYYLDGVSGGRTVLANTWHYVAITDTSGVNLSDVDIGRAGATYFDGFIDEVKAYNYVRTAAQVRADFLARGAGVGTSATLGSPSAGSGRSALSDGLIGYWPMNESVANSCSGGTNDSCDYSGSGNDGAWTNQAAATTTAKFGRAVDLDGTDDYVSVADSAGLSLTGAMTLEGWFKFDGALAGGASKYYGLIGKGSGGTTDAGVAYLLYLNNVGTLYWQVSDDSADARIRRFSSASALTTGNWYHVVATYDGGTSVDGLHVYVNGKLDDATTDSTGTFVAIEDTNADLYIGRNDIHYFNGQIDDPRIYNRALSPKEVRDLYSWAPGPVGYWNFDEGTGTTANDRSTKGNTGTLKYMATSTNGGWTQGKFGKALDFDGTDDYVNVSAADSLNFGTGNFTAEAWVKINSLAGGQMRILNKHTAGTDDRWSFRITSGDLWNFNMNDGTNNISGSGSTPVINKWYHLALVRVGTTVNLYVNGVVDATGTDASLGDVDTSSVNLNISSYSNGASEIFDGQIDEVKIYDYARTQKQIIEDMNAGHPAVGSPVGSALLHFSFDEQQGQVINDKGFGATTTANTVTRGADTTAEATDPTWKTSSECRINGCLSFDGSADFVEADDTSSLDFGDTDDFTLAGWFNRDTITTEDVILAKRNSTSTASDAGYIVFLENTGELVFEVADGTDTYRLTATDATSTVSSTGWNHFVVVWDENSTSTTVIYVNGKDANAASSGARELLGDLSNAVALRVGSESDGATYFDGRIDEVKIYNFALTEDEVKLEYNAGAALNFGTGSLEITSTAPIAEWLFNEGRDGQCAGGTNDVCDTSGNGNDGAKTNMATSTNAAWKPSGDCYSGKCLEFDGTDDYVDLTGVANIEGLNAGTITGWFKTTVGNHFFTLTDGSTADDILFLYTGGCTGALENEGFCFDLNRGGDPRELTFGVLNGGSAYTDGKWHYFAIITGNGDNSIYMDGVKQIVGFGFGSATTNEFTNLNNADTMRIGNRKLNGSNGTYYNGKLDDIRIYNYAFTAAQVAYDYNRGKPIGHWKFDECQGATVYDSSGEYSRGVGSRNNGTITIGASGSNTLLGTCTNENSAHSWYNGRDGKMNASLSFDGTDDLVNVADDSSLDFATTTDFTITGWFNRDTATSDDVLVAKRNSLTTPSDAGYIVYIDSSGDNLIFEVSEAYGTDEYSATSTSSFTSTGWNHFAAVWDDDSSAKIYINGADDSASESGTIANVGDLSNAVALRVGSESDGASYFDGLIDDVRIYTYALNAEQVRKAMNDGAGIRFGPDTGQP